MKKIFSIILLSFSLVLLGSPVFAHEDVLYHAAVGGMNGMMGYGFMGLGLFSMVPGVLFWVGTIVLAYYLLKQAGLFSGSKQESAIEIAKKRFAV